MKLIMDAMSFDDARQFVNGKAFKYLKEYIKETSVKGVDIMLTLSDPHQMFSLQGELTAAKSMLNLLQTFEDIVNPSEKKPQEQPTPLDNYMSQKPKELLDPVILK